MRTFPRSASVSWLGIFAIVLAAPLRAGTPVAMPDSIREVAQAPASGALDPHRPLIVRSTLRAEEEAAPIEFEVVFAPRNFDDLQARVARGERIPFAEMAAKYETPAADYERVARWLTDHGFVITRRDPHRVAIFARGSVRQAATAFQTRFARVAFEGEEFNSAVTVPSVDAAIAPLILGINGLQPQMRAHKHSNKAQILPNASNGNGYYLPAQIEQAYNATGFAGLNITGAGQTIAIVIDRFPLRSDLTLFWNAAGVAQSLNNITFLSVVGSGTNATPQGEESLDVEWCSALAPQAKVRVYATSDLNDADVDQAYVQIYSDAINHPEYGLNQMSMSFGSGENYISRTQVNTDARYFAELAAAGVTAFASSGDAGSTPGNKNATDETGPVQAENPASDPNVTGVGGTSLTLNANNSVASETVWNNSTGASGGGASIYFSRPTWQVGTGVPSGTKRLVPDISCAADPRLGGLVYLNGSTYLYGGTSWSSPTWAGFCALINQARLDAGQGSLGALNPLIYRYIGTGSVRDITSGNNATPNSGGLYAATAGYDEATGIGSPLVFPLAQALVGASLQGPTAGTDSPALPGWGIAVLGGALLFLVARGGRRSVSRS